MSNFTFLTQEQIFSEEKLNIFKKRGTNAGPTDFAKLLGVYFREVGNGWSAENKSSYWTKSDYGDDYAQNIKENKKIKDLFKKPDPNAGYQYAYTVAPEGDRSTDKISDLEVGIRPAMTFSSISSIPTNNGNERIAKDGVLEVEYGYYPQNAASRDIQERLEQAYRKGNILKSRNTYTTNSEKNTPFKTKVHEEYEFNGKRYVREEIKKEIELSNGLTYYQGENVWIEVSPVIWLVDEKTCTMITEDIICAGVQFSKENDYHEIDFDTTEIKTFLDNYLSTDLFQVKKIEQELQKEETQREETKKRIRNQNPYNLNFSEVSESDIIRGAIESDVSVFLHGKPGCGKSDRVKQIDPDFIELNLSHLDPELLDGLAGEKNGKAVHIKPPWLEELEAKCQEESDKIHILFLEELTNASPMMQSKAYGIALDKKVAGRWKIPENARVVAAGNELEDSLVANEMAEPLYDRFAHVNIETTVEGWLEWAVTPKSFYERLDYKKQEEPRQKIHPAIYAFISYKGDEVLRTPYNRENPQPHADPRRWKMASDMLYATNNPNTIRAIVGEELTEDFISFCKIQTITIQDIINGNYTDQDLEMDLGERLATVSALVQVNEENMPKVREFVKKLGPEICKKFEVQWAGGNEERLEQLQELKLLEQEEAEKRKNNEHISEEAKEMADVGIVAFTKIMGGYQEYQNREKKNDKSKEK